MGLVGIIIIIKKMCFDYIIIKEFGNLNNDSIPRMEKIVNNQGSWL